MMRFGNNGEYDAVLEEVVDMVGKRVELTDNDRGGILLMILGGNKGEAFAITADPQTMLGVPDFLEFIAKQIRTKLAA